MACLAVVGGFATTVGTGFIAGGALTIAFCVPQAEAAPSWTGKTGEITATDWATEANWNLDGATWAGTGPGTAGSNLWAFTVDGAVTIKDGLVLEGWNPKFTFDNGANITATMTKIQIGDATDCHITVNNGSHFKGIHNGGHYRGVLALNIGKDSSITLDLSKAGGKEGTVTTVNILDPSAKLTLTSTSAVSFVSSCTIKGYSLTDANDGGLHELKTGITLTNVTLNALTLEGMEGWTLSSEEITNANKATHQKQYYLKTGADGVLSIVYAASDPSLLSLTWSSGTELSWANGTDMGGTAWQNGYFATFASGLGDVTATLTEDIAATGITVEDGTNLIVVRNGNTLTCTNYTTTGTGGVTVTNDAGVGLLKYTGLDEAALPTLTVDGTNVTIKDTAMTASITVLSGTTLISDGSGALGQKYNAYANRTITINEGATLENNGSGDPYYHIVLAGGTLSNTGNGISTGSMQLPIIELTADSTVKTDARLGMIGQGYRATTLDLGGNTLTKTGSDAFHLRNTNVTSGAIDIQAGSLEWLAGTVMNGETTITVGEAGTLDAQIDNNRNLHALVGNGGTVSVADGKTLTVAEYSGTGLKKTGAGTLAITSVKEAAAITNVEAGRLTLVTDVAADATLSITGSATVNALHKTGAGTLTAAGITVAEGGSLTMNYDGIMSITSLGVSNGATLVYGQTGAKLLKLALGTDLTNVALDISALDNAALAAGVDLGITYAGEKSALAELLGVSASDLTLDDGTGTYHYSWQVSAEVAALWDENWGPVGLANAPTSLPEATISQAISLYDDGTYNDGSQIKIALIANGVTEISDNQDAPMAVVGGKYHTAIDGDGQSVTVDKGVWISARGGMYGAIIGGNSTANWYSGTGFSFAGDTHILIDDNADGVADNLSIKSISGGSWGCAQGGNVFTGDTYVTVRTDSVGAGVIGGMMVCHGANAVATHEGDSKVYIYAALTNEGNAYREETLVVGGSYAYNSATATHNGDSLVHVDLSGYVGGSANTFGKMIVGGMAGNATGRMNGTATVVIEGAAGISFSKVIGGIHALAGSYSVGGVDMTLGDAIYTDNVIGGFYHDNALTSTLGDISMTINGGSFAKNVIGVGYHATGDMTVSAGAVEMNLNGGTFNGMVIGGVELHGTGSAKAGYSTPSTTITVDGATINGVLLGGSWTERNNAGYTLNQGDIVLNLISGAINADVYAGGLQNRSTKMNCASTTVNIGDAIVLKDGITVSGGYTGSQSSSTVSGDSTLCFNGEAGNDISGVKLSSFEVVEVSEATATAKLGSISGIYLSKTGAGVLELSKGGLDGGLSLVNALTVKEGTLALTDTANAYVTAGIQVESGAKLDIGSGAALQSAFGVSSLTLDADAILAATKDGAGLGVNLLTVGGAFAIELDSAIKNGDSITLMTGLTGITGIDFTDSIAAAADYLSKVTAGGVDMALDRLQLEYVDGNLYLATAPGQDLTWCGNDGNWSNADTDKVWYDPAWGETPPTPVQYTPGAAAVTFDSTAAGTVTITDAVVTGDMTVTGGDYTFANGGGSLEVEGTLSVSGGSADLSALGTVKAKNVSNAATLVADTLELTGGELTQSTGSLAATAVTGTGNVDISGGTVNIGSVSNAGNVAVSGGTVTIGSVSNAGSVEVSKATIVGDTNAWTATDTTSVTVGDATIGTADTTGNVALSGADSAAVNVNGQIAVNTGSSLELSGNVNLVLGKTDHIIGVDTSQSTYDDGLGDGTDSKNGFITALKIYSFTTGEGEVTADSVNWSIDGVAVDANNASWEDDSLAVSEEKDYSKYYVRTGHNDTEDTTDDAVVSLADINTAIANAGSADITTTIMLDGGKLVVDGDLGNLDIRTNKGVAVGQDTTSVLELAEGTTVVGAPSVVVEDVAPATLDNPDAGKLIVTEGTTVILTGSGTYDMSGLAQTGGTFALPTGVELDTAETGWAGTVLLGDINMADTAVDVSALGDADSTVKANSIIAKSLAIGSVGKLASVGDIALAGGATSTVKDMEVGGALSLSDGALLEATKLSVTGVTTVGGASLNADSAELGGLTMDKGAQVTTTGAMTMGGDLTFNALGEDTAATVNELKLTTDTLNVVLGSQLIQDAADKASDISQPLATLMTVTSGSDADISLNGGSNIVDNYGAKYDYALNWVPSDAAEGATDLQLTAQANPNYVKERYAGATPNAMAGATIMDDAFASGGIGDSGDLADIMYGVDTGSITDNDLAAVAGSSTATLGMALAGDVERQLRAIRNRTTTMGVNQCVVNEGMPYFNAWVNAEGNLSELDQDSTYAGYRLDSWGGTIGFDVDVNPTLTLGLAVTAMYGDLTVDGPDMLEGDMDTYYVSAFARYSNRAWTHTFIGTVGTMDGSYERTVNHSAGGYTTKGDTDGTAFGLMYEVGRTFAIDDDGDACWQPVFNVAYRHTSVSGYREEGGEAALKLDDQTLDTVTFGAGARLQAVVGENLYNRTSVLELRALAKLDVGDRSSEADVAFIGVGRKATVESAELGAFGVELGAGLAIPVGDEDSGTLFFDVSAELRSGYSNVNGTVGYRINF